MNIIEWVRNVIRLSKERLMLSRLDPLKISTKINELNSGGGFWQEVQGLFTVTTVTVDPNNDAVIFNPGQGMILKMFVNNQTGELKSFPAKMFE